MEISYCWLGEAGGKKKRAAQIGGGILPVVLPLAVSGFNPLLPVQW